MREIEVFESVRNISLFTKLKKMNNDNKDLEIERLKKQVAELSKFKHERKGTSKKELLNQISTPAHISEFMKDVLDEKKAGVGNIVTDISCGAGSLLIPWKDSGALLIGADIDEEALNTCRENLPNSLLFKHDSLECNTPCQVPEHLFHQGISQEQYQLNAKSRQEGKGENIYVLNPPFENKIVRKMVGKVLELSGNRNE